MSGKEELEKNKKELQIKDKLNTEFESLKVKSAQYEREITILSDFKTQCEKYQQELLEKTTELKELQAYKGEVDKIKKSVSLMKDNLKIKTELNEKLQKELNELRRKNEEREEQEKEREKELEKLREEVSAAKLQLATDSFEKQEEKMKKKRTVKKYQTKLESMGVNVNSIK